MPLGVMVRPWAHRDVRHHDSELSESLATSDRGATVRSGAKEVSTKAITYAEKNVAASLDYAQKLLHAKDLGDVMRLHSEYVQNQMKALAEQASEMGQIMSRAAMEAAKPKS